MTGPLKNASNETPVAVEAQTQQPKKPMDPKKLAKLEKFKAKQAKLQTDSANGNNVAAVSDAQPKSARQQKKDSLASVKNEAEPVVFVNDTPPGQKKDTSKPMDSAYKPRQVEAAWYQWWEKQGYFSPRLAADGKPLSKGTYVIPIPPPNVTGALHLGHALTNSVQDALIRWNRMRGLTTLYLPGCDHAGIATQAVVEKMLWKTAKQSRHDLGREKFIEKVWDWKEEYGNKIYGQLRRVGSSYDWERACFTMDPKFEHAVVEAFVRLHQEGVIYRDTRLVNWSCKLNTALSNLEVEMKELEGKTMLNVPGHNPEKKYEFGTIVSFAYPIENSDEKIVVATTRLETMLGDTAVAVHPKDERYRHLIGKHVVHPFNGRLIPIIGESEKVDMNFGTGAVKITPAHDPNDYIMGKKHNLQFITLFNDDGTINANGGEFQGLMRFDARIEVLKALKAKGLYVETKPNKMVIPICSRSGDIIEPMLKPQWYVNCQEMAQAAVKAVEDGDLLIQPEASKKEWFSWLNNIQDWCISRQLWWGHRIPAYFCNIKGQENERVDGKYWVSGRSYEEACQNAYARFPDIAKEDLSLEQDDDVLDTWFSSALWPFASFGWPEKTQDLQLFYPNSLLETGWDILFFWVARMVMMGIKLTGQVPFKHVYCHAMVRDAHGRKMSKSLGNVIDPLDVIEGISLEGLFTQLEKGNLDPREIQKAKEGQKRDFPKGIPECGADALRFTLCNYTSGNRDINMDIMRVDGYRKFCNKLWNATKFALMKLGPDFKPSPMVLQATGDLNLTQKWILHRLSVAVHEVNENMHTYNLMNVTNAIHFFWLYDLCDYYIEAAKPVLDDPDMSEKMKQSYKETLYTSLEHGLKLMHPFMPFLTEELYQRLPRRDVADKLSESIMISWFPEDCDYWKNDRCDQEFELLKSLIKSVRSLAADYGVKDNVNVFIKSTSNQITKLINDNLLSTKTLMYAKQLQLKVLGAGEAVPAGCVVSVINEECSVYLLVRGFVDLDSEISKLEQKLEKVTQTKNQLEERMTSSNYEQKVKSEVREADSAKMSSMTVEIEAITKGIHNFTLLKNQD